MPPVAALSAVGPTHMVPVVYEGLLHYARRGKWGGRIALNTAVIGVFGMGCRSLQSLGFLLVSLSTACATQAAGLADLRATQDAAAAELRARDDCLLWVDFADSAAQGLRFAPGPDEGALTPTTGRWPGQRATRIFHGKLMRDAIHVPDSGFTLCCWLRVNDLEKVDRLGYTRTAGGVMAVGSGYYNGWRLLVAPASSTLTFELGRPEIGARRVSSAGHLTKGDWHHVAVTWNHETLAMWIDGELRAETVVTMTYNGGPRATWFRIGECGSGLGVLSFDIADLGLFGAALPPDTLISLGDPDREFRAGITRFLASITPAPRDPADEEAYRRQYAPLFALTGCEDSQAYRVAMSRSRLRVAESYRREGRFEDARQAYADVAGDDVAALHHRAAAMLALGDLHRDRGEYEAARREHEKTREFFTARHEAFRVAAIERLRELATLQDGAPLSSPRQRRIDRISHPGLHLYVSPGGADAHPGTEDKPFGTLERAREAVRQLKQEGALPKGGVAIVLTGGVFRRETEPFVLTEADSGTLAAPIIYQAAPGQTPILRGGRAVSGFEPLRDAQAAQRIPDEARAHVLQLDLRAAGVTNLGRLRPRGLAIGMTHDPDVPAHPELFFDGRPMSLARWPNDTPRMSERFTTVDLSGQETVSDSGRQVARECDVFSYVDPRQDAWADEPDGWLFGCWQYLFFASYNRIEKVDPATRQIHMDWARKTPYELKRRGFANGAPYQGINLLCELDSPGEWYLDRESGLLFFWPPADISEGEAVVSVLESPMITLDGASNVVFRGVTMEAGRQHAIVVTGGHGVLLAGCIIRNMGVMGVKIEGGSGHEIVGCDLAYLGDAGIELEGGDADTLTPSGHVVENCHIHHYARWNRVGYQPAVRMRGVGNRVSHCLVHDAPHQAFCVNGNDNILEYSEVHDVCHEAGDAGAYYMYGRNVQHALLERGQVVRYCYWHDLPHNESFRHVANATRRCIYIDSFNSNITVYGNIFERFDGGSGAVFFGACDNRVENSIFHRCHTGVRLTDRTWLYDQVNKAPKHLVDAKLAEFAFKSVWRRRYPRLSTFPAQASDTSVFLAGNVVARNIISECETFIGGSDRTITLAEIERNWTEGDPGYLDADNGDFRLAAGAPAAIECDFDALPLGKIGLYQDELRATWPVHHKSGNYETLRREPDDVVKRMATADMPVCQSRESTTDITIDGRLDATEWGTPDRANSVILNRTPTNTATQARPSSMWLRHDAGYLYVALRHELNPGETPRPKPTGGASWWKDVDMAEIIFEGPYGENAPDWWPKDKRHGPLFYLVGDCAGQFDSYSIADLPKTRAEGLRGAVQYAAESRPGLWTAEWKIPLAAIYLDPPTTTTCCFNAGALKPGTKSPAGSKQPVSSGDQWVVWRGANGANWKVWNVGLLHLGKQDR